MRGSVPGVFFLVLVKLPRSHPLCDLVCRAMAIEAEANRKASDAISGTWSDRTPST